METAPASQMLGGDSQPHPALSCIQWWRMSYPVVPYERTGTLFKFVPKRTHPSQT